MDDRARDRDLLLLTRGERLRTLVGERSHVEPVDDRVDPAVHLSVDARQLGEVSDVLPRREPRVDADLRGDDPNPASNFLGRRARFESEHLDRSGVRCKQRADDAQGRRLAGAVGAEQSEYLSGPRLERDAAQHLVCPELFLQAVNPDRRLCHLARVVFLVAVERGFADGAFLPAGFLTAVFLAAVARLGLAVSTTSASACASILAGSGSGAVATPMVLDRVRWHVSQVTIVRTSVPR